MSERTDRDERIGCSARQSRWLLHTSTVAGVLLIAVGLHIGGGTPAGLACGVLGAVLGLSGVFIPREQ